jgi:SAM-dependent methyltransferase
MPESTPGSASSEPAPLFRDRARASSFGANAELYDRSRPRYPDVLIDELVARAPAVVLDVGCGTGLLGRSFVERGTPVLGVEPDALMAEVARGHGLDVEVSTFEDWEPRARRFELLVAGQSWHWVTPDVGAAKAADVLVRGGTAVHAWNMGAIDPELGAALDAIYDELVPGKARPMISHHRDITAPPLPSELAFIDTGAFHPPERRDYEWARSYTTKMWLTQLETHSDHALLAPAARQELLAAVAATIDAHGGEFIVRYTCEVTRFERR